MAPKGHPVTMVLEARQLVGDGLSSYAVGKRLGVARETVRRWTDDVFLERSRATARRSNRRHRGRRKAVVLVSRMVDLDQAGVDHNCLAKVLNYDFRTTLTPGDIRDALEDGIDPLLERAAAEIDRTMDAYVDPAPFLEWLEEWQRTRVIETSELISLVHAVEPSLSRKQVQDRLYSLQNGKQKKVALDFIDLMFCIADAPDQLSVLYPPT